MTGPTARWFVRDDRGYLHRARDREDAEFEAHKPDNGGWTVLKQRVLYGELIEVEDEPA